MSKTLKGLKVKLMRAQNKQKFIKSWEEYLQDFGRLGHSTNKEEQWKKIKRTREDMRRLVYEIADEAYGTEESKGTFLFQGEI